MRCDNGQETPSPSPWRCSWRVERQRQALFFLLLLTLPLLKLTFHALFELLAFGDEDQNHRTHYRHTSASGAHPFGSTPLDRTCQTRHKCAPAATLFTNRDDQFGDGLKVLEALEGMQLFTELDLELEIIDRLD